eukprot:CAMPEP_0119002080 /NCGR_PEP_ID=MMETSP1173-20130426/64902_1 /TAXON_ID=1034831 /ORGANISM="Rhizochromulina marina cf, Strain CCMP1243" /LENGTH=39 /DNA_ID= /DNA_START= /DNA_END= /DNA_ORIENTATION=
MDAASVAAAGALPGKGSAPATSLAPWVGGTESSPKERLK